MGQAWPAACFCVALELRMVFAFVNKNGLKKLKEYFMSPRFQCPQINFTGTQPHSFVCRWPVAKSSSSNRDLWPTEPRIFTIYLSYSKILLISEISFPPFFYAFFKTVKFSQMESDFFFQMKRPTFFQWSASLMF